MTKSHDNTQTDEEILEQFMLESEDESTSQTDVFLLRTHALSTLRQALKMLEEMSSSTPHNAD